MNRGFTKTELIVLAVVIGLLALIAFGNSLQRKEEERRREEIENMRRIALAYKIYVGEHKLETKGENSWFKEGKLIGPSSRGVHNAEIVGEGNHLEVFPRSPFDPEGIYTVTSDPETGVIMVKAPERGLPGIYTLENGYEPPGTEQTQ